MSTAGSPSELAKLLSREEDSLLVELGIELSPATRALPQKPEWFREKAQEWLESMLSSFQRCICEDARVREQVERPDDILLGLAIVTVIADLCLGVNVSPLTVAALLVKRGIEALCSSEWASQ